MTDNQDELNEGPQISLGDLEQMLSPENRELLYSILEIAGNPRTDRSRLYAALLGGTFLVPLASPADEPGEIQPGQEVTVNVLTLTGQDGELALPIFTHQEAILLWAELEPPTITLQGEAIFQLTAASPMQVIVLNPGGPFGGQITRPEFEALAQGMLPGVSQPQAAPQPAGAETQNVYIDVPLVPIPEETTDRLFTMMEANAAVRSAYLFLMQVGEAGSPTLTLGLYVEGPAGKWVIPQLTRLLQKESLSFEPYNAPELLLLDTVAGGEAVRQSIQPLFRRDGDSGEEAAEEKMEEDELQQDGTIEAKPGSSSQVYSSSAEEMLEDDAGEGEESSSNHDQSGPAAKPRRRSLWPFNRKG